MKTLRDVKAGDTVFVVEQNRGRQKEPRRTSLEQVVRAGRKYAYIGDARHERKFHRDTGKSWHPDSNERANGRGFDVYLCEQDYLKEQHEASEFQRLKERLIQGYGLVRLTPDAVQAIHEVLDREQGR